jgi:hypothetical protein
MTDLRELTHEHFEPSLNEIFRVSAGADDALDLELIEVTVTGGSMAGVATRHGFSLIFRGPPDVSLPQDVYRFESEKLGVLEFMIVPIVPDERGPLYQAIFN